MKKAILIRFSIVLFMALAVSSAISYYLIGTKLLADNKKHMLNMVHVIDYAMDYDGNIQEEVLRLKELLKDKKARITIVTKDGTVCADTDMEQYKKMENHLERQEIKEALAGKPGYSDRFSDTLQENMLYVADQSENGKYVVRIAIAYQGFSDYIPVIAPVLLFGFLGAYVIAVVIAIRFAGTITNPLREISTELQKVHTDTWDFKFKQYRYNELNIISESTTKLAKEVRSHISRLEFERKVRQEFFSNASHELKTPLTAIHGYAELLSSGFDSDEETRQKFVKRILKATENMTRLIEDILMISRLETKDAEVSYTRIRMNLLLDEIFDSVEPIAAKYQVTVHRECKPVVIEAAHKQMQELLMNLIVNGIKYNHADGNVWVTIGATEHNMVIRVKDDGMGISEADQSRVFERFYRVDKGRSKKMGGTGLGLSIVKHIVEFYGGYMQLKSKLNQGSEFIISIPLERNTDDM